MNNNLNMKRTLTLIAIPVLGLMLLNLSFMFDFLFQSIIDKFFPVDYNMTSQWYPRSKHIFFVVIIAVISWFIFKSKLKELYKAIYTTVPTALILVTMGMFLGRWPMVAYAVGSLFYGTIIFYLYKTKKSWLFYYAVTLVTLALLIMCILRVDI